ncbi:putative transmembrane protein, partial [Rhizoctonia solani 123E]
SGRSLISVAESPLGGAVSIELPASCAAISAFALSLAALRRTERCKAALRREALRAASSTSLLSGCPSSTAESLGGGSSEEALDELAERDFGGVRMPVLRW